MSYTDLLDALLLPSLSIASGFGLFIWILSKLKKGTWDSSDAPIFVIVAVLGFFLVAYGAAEMANVFGLEIKLAGS